MGIKLLTLVTLVAQALTAGTFFAFATFVTPALDRTGSSNAVRAMQSINATILGSPFMIVFGLAAILGLGLPIVYRVATGEWNALLVLSALLYLVGVFGVTAAGNVPLNDALAKSNPTEAAWTAYYGGWMVWNLVRTVANVVSVAALSFGLR